MTTPSSLLPSASLHGLLSIHEDSPAQLASCKFYLFLLSGYFLRFSYCLQLRTLLLTLLLHSSKASYFSVIGLSAMWNFWCTWILFSPRESRIITFKKRAHKVVILQIQLNRGYFSKVYFIVWYVFLIIFQFNARRRSIESIIFSHGWASKAPAPSHNIVCNISSDSDGLQTQLGAQVALSCPAKRAVHVFSI